MAGIQAWRTDTAGGFRLPADRPRNVRLDAYNPDVSKNLRRSTKKIPQEARQCVISGSATSPHWPLAFAARRQPMQNYDPDEAPDPEEWLALDEQERIGLVPAGKRS
jgi:hypothetical protein